MFPSVYNAYDAERCASEPKRTINLSSLWHRESKHSLSRSARRSLRVTSRKDQGERFWNSKPHFPVPKAGLTWSSRKLQDIHQSLNLLAQQGKVEGFFSNVDNADQLRGLVEDIRDAIMAYQVCIYCFLASESSNVRTRPRYNKTSTIRIVSSSWVSLPSISTS